MPYLILDDLTKPYASCLDDGGHDCGPSLMDIKIGRKTTGPWGRCVCVRVYLSARAGGDLSSFVVVFGFPNYLQT